VDKANGRPRSSRYLSRPPNKHRSKQSCKSQGVSRSKRSCMAQGRPQDSLRADSPLRRPSCRSGGTARHIPVYRRWHIRNARKPGDAVDEVADKLGRSSGWARVRASCASRDEIQDGPLRRGECPTSRARQLSCATVADALRAEEDYPVQDVRYFAGSNNGTSDDDLVPEKNDYRIETSRWHKVEVRRNLDVRLSESTVGQ